MAQQPIDWEPYPERVPARLFGIPLAQHPNLAEIALWRRRSIYGTAVEFVVALGGLPLGAARGGIGVIATVANSFLLVLSFIGLSGSLNLWPLGVMIHSALVCSMTVVLIMFFAYASSEEDGADLIVYIIIGLCFVDVIVGIITARFTIVLHHSELNARHILREGEVAEIEAIQPPPAAIAAPLGPAASPALPARSRSNNLFSTKPASKKPPPVQRAQSWQLTPDEDTTIPPFFKCPITGEVMIDPVQCSDGHTYERSAIATWLTKHSTSPNTNVRLTNKNLLPNHALRQAIESHIEQLRGER